MAATLLLHAALLWASASSSPAAAEQCFSKTHTDLIVNASAAFLAKTTVLDARASPSQQACLLDCCSQEGFKCNWAVYKPDKPAGSENCYLFHCERLDDCPLIPMSGVNTYNILKGLDYPSKNHLTTTTITTTQPAVVTSLSTSNIQAAMTVTSLDKTNTQPAMTVTPLDKTNTQPAITVTPLDKTNTQPAMTVTPLDKTNTQPAMTVTPLDKTNTQPAMTVTPLDKTNTQPAMTVTSLSVVTTQPVTTTTQPKTTMMSLSSATFQPVTISTQLTTSTTQPASTTTTAVTSATQVTITTSTSKTTTTQPATSVTRVPQTTAAVTHPITASAAFTKHLILSITPLTRTTPANRTSTTTTQPTTATQLTTATTTPTTIFIPMQLTGKTVALSGRPAAITEAPLLTPPPNSVTGKETHILNLHTFTAEPGPTKTGTQTATALSSTTLGVTSKSHNKAAKKQTAKTPGYSAGVTTAVAKHVSKSTAAPVTQSVTVRQAGTPHKAVSRKQKPKPHARIPTTATQPATSGLKPTTATQSASAAKLSAIPTAPRNLAKKAEHKAAGHSHAVPPTPNPAQASPPRLHSSHQGALKSGLEVTVVVGLVFLALAIALVGRKAMESFNRRQYTRLELNDLYYDV
ncbi:MANSC domain-containing protein 1 [Arapaima gigas]